MIIVIDAYNLLKSILNPKKATAQEEKKYLQKLSHYAAIKKHSLVLIYDGGFWDTSYREDKGNLICWFAGKRKSADDLIKEYVKKYQGKELLVITSDRALAQAIKKINIETLNAYVFDRCMHQAINNLQRAKHNYNEQIYKTTETKNTLLDALMMEDQETLQESEEEIIIVQKNGTLSKKENKRQKLLNKL